MPTYTPADADRAIALWNRTRGDRFPMDRRLWLQNTHEDPHFDPELVRLDGGLIIAKRARVPIGSDGLMPEKGWISALAGDLALLDWAEEALRQRGATTLQIGGDPGHFLPGVPEEETELIQGLELRGYRPGWWAVDLIRDLSDWPSAAETQLDGAIVRPCLPEEAPELLAMLDLAFPGRWRYETGRRLEREGNPENVLVLRTPDRLLGFCHLYHEGAKVLGPSVYWIRQAPGWGGLGPIGLHPDARGHGWGLAMVHAAMAALRTRGVERMGIDWTTLVDFYGKAGFQVFRRYRSYSKAVASTTDSNQALN